MKLSKRTLILSVCAVLALTTTVFGTIAYLTGTDTVTNTFTVGKVDIDVDESVVDEDGNVLDEDGNPVYDEDGNPIVDEDGDGQPDNPPARTEDDDEGEEGNEYHLLPGETYVKDPTVTVEAGSEEAYVRVLVTVNRYSVLTGILGDGFDFFADFQATLGEGWTVNGDPTVDTTADTVTYEVRYADVVSEADADVVLPAVFSEFTVPGAFDSDDLAALTEEGETDPFAVIIEGHAIQTASFDSVDDAWAAFDAQMSGDETTGG